MNKYCRICWNTLNWRQPSGEAQNLEMGDSYVADHGFGHEEWLFNNEWVLSGYEPDNNSEYKYGFLQPINKYRDSYIGQKFSVMVYTVNPDRITLAVAQINNVYVPNDRELSWVSDRMRANGWLSSMRQQLRDLDIPDGPLVDPSPSSIANVRFLPKDVIFSDPMTIINPPHKATRIHRYQPLNWDDSFELIPIPPDRPDDSPDGSETERKRAAQLGTTYDPLHTKLQNRLRKYLRFRYGENAVKREHEFVDLKLTEGGRTTFIEIKMERTVKSCIRLALGQILEYAHYPNLHKADTLLIVGVASANSNDARYLQYMRDTYKIPLYYAQWSWTANELGERK